MHSSSRRAPARRFALALSILSLLALLPSAASAARHHGRHAHSSSFAAAVRAASRRSHRADRRLVSQARHLRACLRSGASCTRLHARVQKAGRSFTAAERNLAAKARRSGRAGASSSAVAHPPTLHVNGYKLSWTSLAHASGYVLVSAVPGQPYHYTYVRSSAATPPPVPGVTVAYAVRAAFKSSHWSNVVKIAYPAAPPAPTPTPPAGPPAEELNLKAAPALHVSGQTLSWNLVAKVTAYILVTKVPGQPEAFTAVSGTSVTPPAVPGKTVTYSVRTAVDGSDWAPPVTIAYPAPPAKEPAPEPRESEAAAVGTTTVGVDTGSWSGSLISELVSGGIETLRVQSGAARTVAQQAPGHIGTIVIGQGGAIGSINPAAYAAEVLSVSSATHPQAVEVLNEPANPAFWSDTTNAAAYARLAKAVHEALLTLPAASRPAELCSWDGGEGPNSHWGAAMKAAGALPYCDGVTAHAYGGKSGSDGGALGGRRDVEGAHAGSGLPVYVTEIGWPTAVGQPPTGDSQQWTEAQQAENMTNFVAWASHTGYVPMVIFFNAVDYGTNTAYGIETSSRKHKLSFSTLAGLSS